MALMNCTMASRSSLLRLRNFSTVQRASLWEDPCHMMASMTLRGAAVVNPAGCVEHVGVEGGHHHHVVTPPFDFAPQLNAGLVPCARDDGVFAFGTIDTEELARQVGIEPVEGVGFSLPCHTYFTAAKIRELQKCPNTKIGGMFLRGLLICGEATAR